MKATVVRYPTKPERAGENQRLIEGVFDDLESAQPEGFAYKVFRLQDGVSFIHVVIEHEVASADSLAEVPAFQTFASAKAHRKPASQAGQGGRRSDSRGATAERMKSGPKAAPVGYRPWPITPSVPPATT